jgi:dTDP-4-dehydrorhamnose reductase
MTKPRLLVTGVYGSLAHHLLPLASDRWEIIGAARQNPVPLGIATEYLDLACPETIQPFFEKIIPDACIHLAAMSRPADCHADPEGSHCVNVDASSEIARLCSEKHIPMVFSSTDMVFDGQRGNYTEEDVPTPLNIYGTQKYLAEKVIAAIYPEAVICRLPLMIGPSGPSGANFYDFIISQFSEGKSVDLFNDEFRSSLSLQQGASAMLWAIDQRGGVYHCGGPEKFSRAQTGLMIAELMGLSYELVHSMPAPQDLAEPRPKDVSMDSRKAYAHGFMPGSLQEGLRRMIQSGLPGREASRDS